MANNKRKLIGDTNQQARAAAMETLSRLKGINVNDLKTKDLAALVVTPANAAGATLLQWLGLVDKDGVIK
jgi:hypothetical protein